MRVTRTSRITGITRTKELDITLEQYESFRDGKLIQEAMPHLSADEREFVISGVTQDEWDKYIKGEPDEEDEYA
jgi:hypothetical protein